VIAVIDLTQKLPRQQQQGYQDIQRQQKVVKVEHVTAPPQLEVVHHVNEQGEEVA
jgi:hypothetical protein